MQNNKNHVDLIDLTILLVRRTYYWVMVCWIIPVEPMMIAIMFNLTHAYFLALWFAGLPISFISIIYLLRKKQKKVI